MRISVLVLGVLVLLIIHTDTNGGFIRMLQVLLILVETRTSIVLYTDMNTDIAANMNIAKKCTNPFMLLVNVPPK